jgi:hypothetical protein
MHKDYGTIVLCAVRYAMGRMTYMPTLVIGYVKEHWNDLQSGMQDIILRDVSEELKHEERSPGWLGHPCDVQNWIDFQWWMKERMRLDRGEAE